MICVKMCCINGCMVNGYIQPSNLSSALDFREPFRTREVRIKWIQRLYSSTSQSDFSMSQEKRK